MNPLLALGLAALAGKSIPWTPSYEAALERAAAERKVVFVAVNMDGESANDRLAKHVYREREIVALAERTLPVAVSAAEHVSAGKPCPRFEGITCMDHRRSDVAARKELLKTDEQGYVVAPQHVFLGPDGAVLLSVPYEVTPDELAWCLVEALRRVDPDAPVAFPAGARPPRRLIDGGVFDPSAAGALAGVPPTREQVLEAIQELKKVGRWNQDPARWRTVLCSDEPEALEFVKAELRSSGGRGGGGGRAGGGPGGAGGAGGAGGGFGEAQERLRQRVMHVIGVVSPPAYWEICVEFLGDADEGLAAEAAVALEQLAAPASVRAITTALQKSDEPAVTKELLRALGSAGAGDKNARALLLKRAEKEKDELLRRNAIAALGWLAPGEDVRAGLLALARKGAPLERQAAVCALGLSRDDAALEPLEALRADAAPDLAATIDVALGVLRSKDLKALREPLEAACQDAIHRERFFGPVAPR